LITKKIKNGFDFSKFVEDACREKVNELIEILKRENSNSNIRESNNEAE
jgi:GTP cyclohydrolase FolE2